MTRITNFTFCKNMKTIPKFKTWLCSCITRITNFTLCNNMKTVPKFEKPNSLNGPSRVHGGPIFNFDWSKFWPSTKDSFFGAALVLQGVTSECSTEAEQCCSNNSDRTWLLRYYHNLISNTTFLDLRVKENHSWYG